MKIVSYNVNGLRSAISKGFIDWLAQTQPDVLCLQETRCEPKTIDLNAFKTLLPYYTYFYTAKRKGYSGVAVFTKIPVNNVIYGMGYNPLYDDEARVMRVDFDKITLINAYFPSGTSGEERQKVKMEFLSDFSQYIHRLQQERPYLVITGDYNIAHQEIDIHNPVGNKKSAGFLPEERAWLSEFLKSGFVDAFRALHPQTQGAYSWWSHRALNGRARNIGWRIDYHLVSENLRNNLKSYEILKDVAHSDHCPIVLTLENP